MKIKYFTFVIMIGMFVIGMYVSAFAFEFLNRDKETPLGFRNYDRISPFDRIKEHQIQVYDDKIIIDLEGRKAYWSTFKNSKSMDNTFDVGANGLEVEPRDEQDIYVGDIIAYEDDGALVVHRVVGIEEDEQGKKFYTKGDNNNQLDKGFRRFEDINYVYIGIIY